MSGIPETRQVLITSLSPVHMGTDEDYAPTNYVIEGDILYEFDHRALSSLPDDTRKKLASMLEGKASGRMLMRVQALFFEHRKQLIPHAINQTRVSHGVAELYRSKIGQAAHRESGGRTVQNKLEIERVFYNPLNRYPILPGSGLKGAIRTALLNSINHGQQAERGERNRDLQQRLFQYSMKEIFKDPMRLVQVGDCAGQDKQNMTQTEVLFAVNRRKKAGDNIKSQAEKAGLYQLLETVTPFHVRAYTGQIGISNPGGVLEHQKIKLPEYRFSFEDIAIACNHFYSPIWDMETKLLSGRGLLDQEWRKATLALLQQASVQMLLKNNKAFLLRVGRHSGAESVTLNGVRNIKIMQGRDKQPLWEKQAKTVWLAASSQDEQKRLRPFGWLLVEMAEGNEVLPEILAPKIKQSIRNKEHSSHPEIQQGLPPAEIARQRMRQKNRMPIAQERKDKMKQGHLQKKPKGQLTRHHSASSDALKALQEKFNRGKK